MSKKNLNIVLLVFVAGLWGTVIYRYTSQYFFRQEEVKYGKEKLFSLNNKIHKKDTFEMTHIRRDPFLNKPLVGEEKKQIPTIPRVKSKIKREPITVEEYMPSMEYFGYIKANGESKKELVLVKYNGVLTKLKLGEDRGGLKVIKVFTDSAQVSYKKKVFFIKKN